jgi:hypothetical protein
MTNKTATGLNQTEYNALVHAIWRLDSVIDEAQDSDTPIDLESMRSLNRDRRALADVAKRMTNPALAYATYLQEKAN